MTRYTLYYCEEGRIAEIAEISCTDDATAVDEAQRMFDGRALVLWCGERNVASWARQERGVRGLFDKFRKAEVPHGQNG
jgi:hypothetical protein